jgi:hypothetical protein
MMNILLTNYDKMIRLGIVIKMISQRRLRALIISLCLMSMSVFAEDQLGQTIQIYTQFRHFFGKPTWLLIIREVETGIVTPYIFDIRNNQNYWLAFTYGHHYRITVSNLKFGTYGEINNFCGLENGILSGISMYMTLTGVLSPDPKTTKCFVHQYKNASFTIVNKN